MGKRAAERRAKMLATREFLPSTDNSFPTLAAAFDRAINDGRTSAIRRGLSKILTGDTSRIKTGANKLFVIAHGQNQDSLEPYRNALTAVLSDLGYHVRLPQTEETGPQTEDRTLAV